MHRYQQLIENFSWEDKVTRLYPKSSKPVYLNTEELSRREKRFDFSILRTDRGLISGREALADNIGGELIIEINVAEE